MIKNYVNTANKSDIAVPKVPDYWWFYNNHILHYFTDSRTEVIKYIYFSIL